MYLEVVTAGRLLPLVTPAAVTSEQGLDLVEEDLVLVDLGLQLLLESSNPVAQSRGRQSGILTLGRQGRVAVEEEEVGQGHPDEAEGHHEHEHRLLFHLGKCFAILDSQQFKLDVWVP